MAVVCRERERFHRRDGSIVAEDPCEGVEIDTLPVTARPVKEKDGVLARVASKTIARHAFQKCDEFFVAAGEIFKEGTPDWYRRAGLRGSGCRLFCDKVRRASETQVPGVQVDRAIRSCEQPRVLTPQSACRGQLWIGMGEAL